MLSKPILASASHLTRICISPQPQPLLLLLLLLSSTASIHNHGMKMFHAEGLQFSMPNFLDTSKITLVTEGAWYTNQGFTGSFVSKGAVVLNILTNASLLGRMVYHEPINLLNPRSNTTVSFTTSFTFQIITRNLSQCGSGLVFAVTDFLQSPATSTGDRLGLVNSSTYDTTRHFFAVEFDTYWNYASYYTADPSDSHLGVDVGTLFSSMIYDTSVIPSLNLYNNYTFMCWVEYNSSTHFIRVWMSNTTTLRPLSPLIEFKYDLSLVTTDSMYIGFTGSNYGCGSGDQSSTIFSWDFNSDLDGDLLSPAAAPAGEERSVAEPMPEPSSRPLSNREIVLLSLIVILSLVIIAGVLTVVLKPRGRKKGDIQPELASRSVDRAEAELTVVADSSTGAGSRSLPAEGAGPHMFDYSDVVQATKDFSEENKIGEGLSSKVYKGVMPGGAVVAVKRLKEGVQGDFFREMSLISNIRHPNLLELKGWCYHKSAIGSEEAILIYDYMRNGSLEAYLFGKQKGEKIKKRVRGEEEGRVRMKILVGVAAALDHLHRGTEKCVLHRDVKAANVLLTEGMEAKLGDFGLARLVEQNRSMIMTRAMGTLGYAAPEVLSMAKITDKADVYSFGVLILEVACGKRALMSTPGVGADRATSAVHLIDWVNEIVMTSMSVQHCIDQWIPATELGVWERIVNLGRACCSQTPRDRPNMREVYGALQHLAGN